MDDVTDLVVDVLLLPGLLAAARGGVGGGGGGEEVLLEGDVVVVAVLLGAPLVIVADLVVLENVDLARVEVALQGVVTRD